VVQVLHDFEGRVISVQEAQAEHTHEVKALVRTGFTKINEATELFGQVETSALRTDAVLQLVRHAVQIDTAAPSLVLRFAQAELERMSEFLKELGGGGHVMYEGEDRDWMLSLARTAERTIDATSLTTVDAGGRGFVDGGLWSSDLGQRYMEVQREAIERKVRVRRLFIMDRSDLVNDIGFVSVYQRQQEMGIEVKVLDSDDADKLRRSAVFDFVVFDNVLSYETTPASLMDRGSRPAILNTRLELRQSRVNDRAQRFRDLWEAGHELDLTGR
jgi:hypothetical protein